MFAETAYLFRHGVLRDCAYGLQLPSERGRLSGRISMAEAKHALGRTQEARELIESVRQAAQAAGQKEIASDCDEVLAKFNAGKP